MLSLFSRSLLILGCLGLVNAVGETDAPIHVYPSDTGSSRMPGKNDYKLVEDAEFQGNRDYKLAIGAGSQGGIIFRPQNADEFGLASHSFGVQFPFHVTTPVGVHTYGLILGIGGSASCVMKRLRRDATLSESVFTEIDGEPFCKGIIVAPWSDYSAPGEAHDSATGFYIYVGGVRKDFIYNVNFLDAWKYLTVRVNRNGDSGAGTFEVFYDEEQLGEYVFENSDMDGEGDEIFWYGESGPDDLEGSRVIVSDVLIRTMKDLSALYSIGDMRTYSTQPITWAAVGLFIGIVAVAAQYVYDKL
mmetsp:Transcript_11010/g.16213  ORF Transcript_11010/g.16213 Transcript_11010/m.16213 type:complete len:302 (-) Transcript_11010:393-1298(-)|eukprot:CAMPEP_0113943922 /NCGR_PEP_ID=MMETSP1339-20121228/29528_1 /TAXON_ID=94617 /ORGANISM="Fibrocapsa japonica" /LENGTH=301 /DNA_ID=CAMNT_0000948927 /DNA_START=129 /DNA_END=1034 /DNA_ORIENTATION=+ /assembly_acc=CAM_ASM_000762